MGWCGAGQVKGAVENVGPLMLMPLVWLERPKVGLGNARGLVLMLMTMSGICPERRGS